MYNNKYRKFTVVNQGGDNLNRVKEVRLQKGISQQTLAKKLRISVSHLNRIENNGRKLPLALAVRIAKALECNMDEFFLHQKFTISKREEREDGET